VVDKTLGGRPRIDHYLTPLRLLGRATQDGLARFCEALTPRGPGRSYRAVDLVDERLARARRESLGRRGLLVSWHPEPDGSWRARLSGPGEMRTIERSARTRSLAIVRSARALASVQSFRARIGPSL
jgi:hypothetical protein